MTPPELPYHRYLGAFRVGAGGLVIADRCYVDKVQPLLAVRTPARPGTWHAFVRPDPSNPKLTLALTAVHEAHLGTYDVFETPEAAQARAWSEKVEGQTDFLKYSPDATFVEGDRVRHSKFGDGCVTRIIEGKKVEILVREGPRTLVHRPPDPRAR